MAEFEHPVRSGFSTSKPGGIYDPYHHPYWAHSQVQYAQNLLEYSEEPIEYDYDDRDYWDNSFFFPEDCSWPPSKGWEIDDDHSEEDTTIGDDDTMIPGLPDIKMLDAEALSDLLEDNLSPPEITSILVFATNGAIFAYASSLPSRQLRNLSATYGAAYTCYAKNASSGNLTGVNPASHPSSYVTAQSVSLGGVGSIVFELDDLVAVVTRIADKVLLAAVGPSKSGDVANANPDDSSANVDDPALAEPTSANGTSATPTNGTTPNSAASRNHHFDNIADALLESQYEVDRSRDLARLSSLNLSASPSILLALESKSAALGRFLSQKLEDLESPEDF
ncbi:hypothetical protein P175DRAFT_0536229 [Aspergillus ochraceoroseus IBT 24754]|uniref:Uncharacterized protein n=3 Tax=Aspergillus subgen. Nidulantes TaxID=2720870 RepID=A0A0F8V562_9EURO|nr:uncharacterized protein P175DRAFT_0536229 [Aspergillus ochraceoroseus IBT 24754]KKK16329.1 hypothetical protein AOCH_003137 [Aspergillus ochraceoroseus]KKK18126.1 hypothetical protein ARAM_007107 [Aspergillus rambellii]PTU17028.1 hypothetical protein P175DRAFT_0536229 [Aspergillus ochraceoroseus IBT 24754]